MEFDTIAAISTGLTQSGIGIVRMSGPESISIIEKVFQSKKSGFRISDAKTHTIHYGYLLEAPSEGMEQKIIDEVLVSVFRAPNSYTAEDTVEINCHGGIYVMKKILETVVKAGARIADPGEFTKRAFLNGRMDLTQAEAVMDLIASKNEYALKSSLNHLRGDLQKKIVEFRQEIIHEIAFIESALDDPEHISLDGYPETLLGMVKKWSRSVWELIKHADNGKILKEGIKTVIVGKPNAGKSSLLNCFLGEEKAIVTSVEGTTRDILEESVYLDGIVLNIVDTAGIRSSEDLVEKIGIERARKNAENADLILYVLDSSVPMDENDALIQELIASKKVIIILNKTDLPAAFDFDEIRRKEAFKEIPQIVFSAKENLGLKELQTCIRELFLDGELSFNDEVVVSNMRQKENLVKAYDSLLRVQDSIDCMMPEDFFTVDLMDAYVSLGNITGDSLGEDLVNEIFSKFCMGK